MDIEPMTSPAPLHDQPDVNTSNDTHRKHFLAVFFLNIMWGIVGADRFYLGKWVTAILKLLTLGGFGIWIIIDLILNLAGSTKDKQGRPLLDYERYKGLAVRIVIIQTVATVVILLLNGLLFGFMIQQLGNSGFEDSIRMKGLDQNDYNYPQSGDGSLFDVDRT